MYLQLTIRQHTLQNRMTRWQSCQRCTEIPYRETAGSPQENLHRINQSIKLSCIKKREKPPDTDANANGIYKRGRVTERSDQDRKNK